ncbi:hypothetical protein ACWJJH_02485 [Endozoicomonadaceae bacterium StTr2]
MFSRTTLIYIICTLFPFSVGILLNLNTSDFVTLILYGYLAGFIPWLIYIYRDRNKYQAERYKVYCSNPKRGLIEYPLSYFMFVSVGITALSLINRIPLESNIEHQLCKLAGYEQQHIRHKKFEIMRLQCADGGIYHKKAGDEKAPVGQSYEVKINQGLLGFPVVLEMVQAR